MTFLRLIHTDRQNQILPIAVLVGEDEEWRAFVLAETQADFFVVNRFQAVANVAEVKVQVHLFVGVVHFDSFFAVS